LGLLADLTSPVTAILAAAAGLVAIGAVFAVASPETRGSDQPAGN
jgi:hypothetical protein